MTERASARRVALVTGASRGIGAATARALAARGHRVAINCLRNVDLARRVLADCGGDGVVLPGDVRDPAELRAVVARAIDQLGPIEVAVHNANLDFPIGPFAELEWSAVAEKVLAELGALHTLVAAVAPAMVARRFGRIVAVSSVMSRKGSAGFGAYAAAKGAVDGAMVVLARELGRSGVTANIVAPGVIETGATAHMAEDVRAFIASRTPAGRLGRPEDVAGAIALLASDDAGWINGQYIALDDGFDGGLPFGHREIVALDRKR